MNKILVIPGLEVVASDERTHRAVATLTMAGCVPCSFFCCTTTTA